MVYIFLFCISILLNVWTDHLILSHLHHYSPLFLSFFLYFTSFLGIFIFKRKISFSLINIVRSVLCSIAFFLTFKAYSTPGVDVIKISSMYYAIPVFESVMSIIRKYSWKSLLSIICNIICFFMFGSGCIPLIGVLGCFLFSLSDIIISQSKSDDFLVDVSSVSFIICIFFLVFGILSQGYDFFSGSIHNRYLWCAAAIAIVSEILVFYSYKNEDPVKLSPFRYVDLLFLNLQKREIKVLFPFVFMIARLVI
jgi:hypothetical protein